MQKLLTFNEVAQTLGLSVRKVRLDAASGRFGPELVRFGRAVRIPEAELAAWIEAGCPDRERWESTGRGGEK